MAAGCTETETDSEGEIIGPRFAAPDATLGADAAAPGDAGLWLADASSYATDSATFSRDPAADAGRASDAAIIDASGDAMVVSAELCKLHGYEVALVGDSYMHLTGFASVLAELTHKAGVLPANETYVDHSLSGASMDGFPNISAQWPDALADAKRRGAKQVPLLIMTGGGNDVLVNNRYCLDFKSVAEVSQACKDVVQKAMSRAQGMIDQVLKDGVKEVIYFFYPHLPKGGIGGGPYPNTILDYSLPIVRDFCQKQTALKCHFVDLVPAFDDGTGYARPGLINIDGIHPTAEGTKIMADVIWKVMQDHCLASQKP